MVAGGVGVAACVVRVRVVVVRVVRVRVVEGAGVVEGGVTGAAVGAEVFRLAAPRSRTVSYWLRADSGARRLPIVRVRPELSVAEPPDVDARMKFTP